MAGMVLLAVLLGRRMRSRAEKEKNSVLIGAAIAIDAVELFNIVMHCVVAQDPLTWLQMLPLFLCTVQLITLPLAAFAHGRIKEAALDFVLIFGILGAVMGTFAAGQNYAAYPVLSLDNVFSGLTHAIAGFASLYIAFSGMTSLKKRNIGITYLILIGICALAYVADVLIPYNYMFLMRGDGTPYDLFYDLVNGNPVLYPLCVVALFLLYIAVFYGVCFLLRKKKRAK